VTPLLRYRHSGVYSLSGLIAGLSIAAGLSAVASLPYAYALHFIPFAFINCFVVFAFGLGVGFATAFGLKRGNVRNLQVVTVAAALIGVLADYFGWVVWLFAASGQVFIAPNRILTALSALAQTGVWSIGRATPTGSFLYLIWLSELLAICALAAFAARNHFQEQAFCESCQRWLPESTKIGPLEPLTSPNPTPEALKALSPMPPDSPIATHLELRSCPTCTSLNLVTAKSVFTSTDGNGKRSSREATVFEDLLVDTALLYALRQKPGVV